MLYTSQNKSFKQHVHPSLRRRIRIFIVMAVIMFAIVLFDIIQGTLGLEVAVVSIVIGSVVGYISSRIFHLSWDHDGNHVVGRIDKIGLFVLVAYIAFEIVRASLVQEWLPASTSAITFAFVASALITRVLGLRGRIVRILKQEHIFK